MYDEAVMKIVLDRRSCNCWDAAGETHFGWHFLRSDLTPIDCTVEVVDDERPEIIFFIKDCDGQDKELVVNNKNRAEAYDSWQLAWEKQQIEKGSGSQT
jgi:hypothetical protein